MAFGFHGAGRERGGAFGMHRAWSMAHRVNGFAHCSANAENGSFCGIYKGFAEGFVAFFDADAVLFGEVFDFNYGVRHLIA